MSPAEAHVPTPCRPTSREPDSRVPAPRPTGGAGRGNVGSWLFRCVLLLFPLWAGCDGCRFGRDRDPAAREERRPEAEFTFGGARPLPLGSTLVQSGVKPGHWFTLAESIRSNRDDHRGTLRHTIEIESQSGSEFQGFGASQGVSRSIERLPMTGERPAVLARGRTKRLDSRLLAASPSSLGRSSRGFLQGHFTPVTQTALYDTGRQLINVLQPQEYFFVVLTSRPERFTPLQSADWVRTPISEEQFAAESLPNYRLVFPDTEGLPALPETMLDWTSTAVLLWDDLEPSALTPDQMRAVVDWVHFGGRLIINGPGAGTSLSRSRLGELLPMEIEGNSELDPDDVQTLLRGWSVMGDTTVEQQLALVQTREARVVVDGTPHPAAAEVDRSGGLVLKRAVGSGAVVLSRFDLMSDWIRGWRSGDGFFNGAFLQRPPRTYVTRDGITQQLHMLAGTPGRAGPQHNTGFRLLARDGGFREGAEFAYVPHPIQGLGGWRDDSDAATLAVQALRAEAGIVIPPRRFVVNSLALYLIVLVPINYVVFRVLRRLEWAWLAVPVIGLIGAAWIARGAQLDVGFARSQSEIAVVEVPADYSRGHVTRFISLYNSLSRRYDLSFDSPDAVAAPLGVLSRAEVDGDHHQPVTLRYGYAEGPALVGVPVASNRSRVFHTEQLLDLGGTIRLEDDRLRNDTLLDLVDTRLVGKSADGSVRIAYIGACDAGSTVRVRWSQDETPLSDSMPLGLHRLMRPLAAAESLPAGTTRLIARTEQPLSGLTITPESSQQTHAAVVVAHLELPQAPTPGVDEALLPTRFERRQMLLDEDGDVEYGTSAEP